MPIYTGRGDEGKTDLRNAERVAKTSPRIEAYGTIDEVNALVGRVRPTDYDDVDDHLRAVQNHLHVLQADLADPEATDEDDTPRIEESHVAELEGWIDEHDEELDPLQSFVLPGGGDAGARLHHARTVCRRAERRAVALAEESEVTEAALVYLNRLSDVLFTLARVVNQREGESEEAPEY